MLDLVGVGDHASPEYLGGSGDVGEPLGDQAAGAALRGAQGEPTGLQTLQHHILQGGDVHPVDQSAEPGLQLLYLGEEEGLGLLLGGGLGGDPQLTLPLLGVGSQGGVGHGVHLVPKLGLHGGFADAEQLQSVGGDDPLGQGLEIGDRPVVEHGAALAGGAGEHDDMDAVRLEGTAGSGAPVVDQNGAPLGDQGLLKVVFRQGASGAPGVVLDALQRFLVIDQLFPKNLGQDVFGQVVTGGAQAAGGDDDIGPAPGQLHRLPGPLRIVAHYCVVVDVKPQLA